MTSAEHTPIVTSLTFMVHGLLTGLIHCHSKKERKNKQGEGKEEEGEVKTKENKKVSLSI